MGLGLVSCLVARIVNTNDRISSTLQQLRAGRELDDVTLLAGGKSIVGRLVGDVRPKD
eukprot:SAG22_NODE_497_length_9790_cov_3.684178_5_plen_58_part_00